MWGNAVGFFLCNYSFITSLVGGQGSQSCTVFSRSVFPSSRASHMCTSDRQSNMTAIYTHWARWKVLAPSLRPRSPKRMRKKTDKAGGKRPVNSCILGCLGCFRMAAMCAPVLQQIHTHTHALSNTAARVLWCSRCCICCACLSSQIISSTGSKTWKQRQTTYSKVSNDTSAVSC